MTDFIIVGRGLAATVLVHRFHQCGISFKVVGNQNLSHSSRIAAGIWNPIVFKRYTKSWMASELIDELIVFYAQCGVLLQKQLVNHRPILKPFTEQHEKDLWLKKSKNELQEFLSPDIYYEIPTALHNCIIPNGYGVVTKGGNLNMELFLDTTSEYFSQHIISETFDYSALQINQTTVTYKHLQASSIVFCEGYLVKHNPYFSWIPLKPVKGEILDIKCESLKFKNAVFNKDGFLMDTEDGTYKLGATYNWNEHDEHPTSSGKHVLELKLKQMASGEYTIVGHKAGVRPASTDRRPIIGPHPVHKNAFVFNGLGTKGVMLAPFFSKNFVNFYLNRQALNPEVDIKRVYHIYEELHKK